MRARKRTGRDLAAVAACLTLVVSACGDTTERATGPRVAIVQDGSIPDARSLVTPAVLAAELGLREAGIEPWVVDVGGDPAGAAMAVAADGATVAAIVAPFTPSASTATVLQRAGVPVVSLSQDDLPDGFLRMGPSVKENVDAVLGLLRGRGACLMNGTDPWALRVADALAAAGDALSRAATANGCGTVVWSGSAAGAEALRDGSARLLILTDQARTQGFLRAVGQEAGPTAGICGCVDPGSAWGAGLQSFVHAYQRETGLDPGPYAAEAFDAATMLGSLATGGLGRTEIAEALNAVRVYEGSAARYEWNERGALMHPRVRTYRAGAARWLAR